MLDIAPLPALALSARCASLSNERLVALVRGNPAGLSPAADALDAAAMAELSRRLTPVAYRALCDALA